MSDLKKKIIDLMYKYGESDELLDVMDILESEENKEDLKEFDPLDFSGPTKAERHAEICKTLTETYINKNHDYGDSFGETYQDLGIISAVTRMTDKMNRIKNTAKGRTLKAQDEKLEDSVLDLANYSIMLYIELMEDKRG